MKKTLFSAFMVFSTVVGASAFAANTPPGFNSAQWTQLVSKIVTQGTQATNADGEWRTLSSIVPANTTQPHTANYISTIGFTDQNGNYGISNVSDVSENWQVNSDGNWVIDQWIWGLSPAGDLIQLMHNQLIETKDNQVLSDNSIATGLPTDAAELARWGQALEAWYALP